MSTILERVKQLKRAKGVLRHPYKFSSDLELTKALNRGEINPYVNCANGARNWFEGYYGFYRVYMVVRVKKGGGGTARRYIPGVMYTSTDTLECGCCDWTTCKFISMVANEAALERFLSDRHI